MAGIRGVEEVFLKGKVKWVKHIQPDTAFDPHSWQLDFYPDQESLDKFKELKKQGVQNHIRMDDDGTFIKFRRPTERKWKGVVEGMAPPRVIMADGSPVEVKIGNGSDGILGLEIYSHKTQQPGVMKKAARWKSLRVDNFIPFNADAEYPEEYKAELKTLREEPAQEQLF